MCPMGSFMPRKIYLHIGTEKTGSSYIQRFFKTNALVLRRRGILYPVIDGQENHSILAWHVSAHRMQPENFRNEDGAAYLERVAQQIAASDDDSIVVLSSEHFHSRCIGPQVKFLKSLLTLAGLKVDGVIVCLRDQAGMAISSYSTAVMSGTCEKFSIADISPFNDYFNHETLCDQWPDAFTPGAMKIRSYNYLANNDLVEDFFTAMGIVGADYRDLVAACAFPDERIHARFDAPVSTSCARCLRSCATTFGRSSTSSSMSSLNPTTASMTATTSWCSG